MKIQLTRHLRTRLALRQTFSFALLVVMLAWSAYGLLARHVYGQVDDEVQDHSIAVRSMLQVRDGHVRWLNQEADIEVREQFERAIRFYQKHGFAIAGLDTNPRSGAPLYRMSWRPG